MESKFVSVKNKKMHYKTFFDLAEKNKTICFFIHGASPTTQNTEFWLPILPQIVKNCQPIFLDGYGHGLSDKPKENEQVSFEMILSIYQDFISNVLQNEQINSFILIGRSLGGNIVHSVAKHFEKSLFGIGLIAPAGASQIPNNLQAWNKKTSVLWDSEDPAVSFDSFSFIQSTVSQVKLFVIGAKSKTKFFKNILRKTNSKPSHVPELEYPDFFEEFLKSLL